MIHPFVFSRLSSGRLEQRKFKIHESRCDFGSLSQDVSYGKCRIPDTADAPSNDNSCRCSFKLGRQSSDGLMIQIFHGVRHKMTKPQPPALQHCCQAAKPASCRGDIEQPLGLKARVARHVILRYRTSALPADQDFKCPRKDLSHVSRRHAEPDVVQSSDHPRFHLEVDETPVRNLRAHSRQTRELFAQTCSRQPPLCQREQLNSFLRGKVPFGLFSAR